MIACLVVLVHSCSSYGCKLLSRTVSKSETGLHSVLLLIVWISRRQFQYQTNDHLWVIDCTMRDFELLNWSCHHCEFFRKKGIIYNHENLHKCDNQIVFNMSQALGMERVYISFAIKPNTVYTISRPIYLFNHRNYLQLDRNMMNTNHLNLGMWLNAIHKYVLDKLGYMAPLRGDWDGLALNYFERYLLCS